MEPRGGMGESNARVGTSGGMPASHSPRERERGGITDNVAPATRAKRKKARPTTAPPTTTIQPPTLRPIPQPYLALAPKPVSSYSRSRLDEQLPISSNLVLPSSFRRPTIGRATTSRGDAGPSTSRSIRERERFANSLLAPPAIRAGGSSKIKNRPVSPSGNNNSNSAGGGGNANATTTTNPTRRRQGERSGAVRGLGAGNPSMTSLGHLGRILEADPTLNTVTEERSGAGQVGNPPTTRRRRRIVQGEASPGVQRRLTVSSREEGRALGLARGASMRRLNVWDDLPENNDAPPPFPFPTTSTSRLPPTFQSTEPPAQPSPPTDNPPLPIPNSPPPTFEQATGLHPLPAPLVLPPITPVTSAPVDDEPPRPESRASTQYLSAPPSPVLTIPESESASGSVEGPDDLTLTQEERRDRRLWNSDLLAGYTLSERVERELNRKRARDEARTIGDGEAIGPATSPEPEEVNMPESDPGDDADEPQLPDDLGAGRESEQEPTPEGQPSENENVDRATGQQTGTIDQPEIRISTTRPEEPEEPGEREESASPTRSEHSQETGEHQPPMDPEPSPKPESAVKRDSSSSESVGTDPSRQTSENATASPTGEMEPGSPPTGPEEWVEPGAEHKVDIRPEVLSKRLSASSESVNPGTSQHTAEMAPTLATRSLGPIISPAGPGTPEDLAPTLDVIEPSTDLIPEREPESVSEIKPSLFENVVESTRRQAEAGLDTSMLPSKYSPPAPKSSPHKSRSPGSSQASTRKPAGIAPTLPVRNQDSSQDALADTGPSTQIRLPPSGGNRPLSASNSSQQIKSTGPTLPARRPASPPPPPSHSQRSSSSRDVITDDVPLKLPSAPPAPPAPLFARPPLFGGHRPLSDTSTSQPTKSIAPTLPTRRPPPPPPKPYSLSFPRNGSRQTTTTGTAPKLPPRRPPPPPPQPHSPSSSRDDVTGSTATEETPPPLFGRDRPLSSTSTGSGNTSGSRSDVSSMFDRRSHSTIAPLPTPTPTPMFTRKPAQPQGMGGWKRFDRSPHKPRGPRPPPPPPRPRTWAKVVSVSLAHSQDHDRDHNHGSDSRQRQRPNNERTHSTPLVLDTNPREDSHSSSISLSVRSPTRSTSEQNLSSTAGRRGPGQGPRSPEYTDLDVFISRLEGSGREYEGYSQIAQFLGPAKAPGASQEALSTLLPGPILIESKRLTKEGITKLKLSLLGVRVTKCPICLAQFREGELGVIIPGCGHLGHEKCVRRWFREDDRCFVCRVRLKVEEGVV